VNEQERAAFRAFVRDNHPDRGGDPDVFVAGLARFRSGPEQIPPADPDDPRWDDPRWDAPVEFVEPLPAPVRVAVALIRTWHRHRRRHVQ
jgi:hypothetical protein